MTQPVQVTCPGCGASVEVPPVGDVARCAFCKAVVRISGRTPVPPPPVRPPVPMPRGIRVEPTAGGFRILRRWFSPIFVVLAFFAAIWLGMLAFGYGMMVSSGAPLFVMLFPLLHVGVGVGLGYWALCGFLNTTTVEAEGGRLTVRHRPLPWPGNATWAAAELSQVYVKEKVHRHKDGGETSTYDVLAVTREGRGTKLLSGLPDADSALFVEQEIERRLGIEDRPVAGEVERS